MLNLKDYISPLDTKRFGFKIAKTDFHKKNNINEIISFLSQQEIDLIITKVVCENISLINQLENTGFRIMDFQVGYDYYGTKEKEISNKNNYTVQKIKPGDIPHLVRLAENSFNGFGHYFADDRLDKNKCLEIYKDWTQNACTKKEFADVVFAAYYKKNPIGFFAFKKKIINSVPAVTGVIGAVASKYAGKGVFQSLIQQGIEWAAAKNLVLRDIKVHSTNYPINAAFSKLGFRISNSCVTMHYWNNKKEKNIHT
jgi:GNAT superfamily N-acetyltransferase